MSVERVPIVVGKNNTVFKIIQLTGFVKYINKQFIHFLKYILSNRPIQFNQCTIYSRNSELQLFIFRVQSDKYRTGIITIVPVRTASVKIEKYLKFETDW